MPAGVPGPGMTRRLVALVTILVLGAAMVLPWVASGAGPRTTALAQADASPDAGGTPGPAPTDDPGPTARPDTTQGPDPARTPRPGRSDAPDTTPDPTPEPTATPEPRPDEPIHGDELTELRTEASRTYRRPDGSLVTEFFADPVFFRAAPDGDLEPIDPGFGEPDADGAVTSERAPTSVIVRAAAHPDGFLVLRAGERRVRLALTSRRADAAAGLLPATDERGRRADLVDALGTGVTLRVVPRATGAVTFLLVDEAAAADRWVLLLDAPGLTVRTADDGGLELLDADGSVIAAMPRPLLTDSSETPGDDAGRTVDAVTMEIEPRGDRTALVLSIDARAAGAVTYPVSIDLGLTLPADPGRSGTTSIAEGFPDTTFDERTRPDAPFVSELWLGRAPWAPGTVDRVLLDFPDLSAFLVDVTVRSASLRLMASHQADSPRTLDVLGVTGPWRAGRVTWTDRPETTRLAGDDPDTLATSQGRIAVTDLTDTIRAWSRDGDGHGLLLTTRDRGRAFWRRIATGDRRILDGPRLRVAWHRPVVTPVSPVDGATDADGVLTWSYDDGWPGGDDRQAAFEVEVATDTGFGSVVAASGVVDGRRATWTVDPALLAPGVTHHWRVRVSDGTSWSRWAGAMFSVPDPPPSPSAPPTGTPSTAPSAPPTGTPSTAPSAPPTGTPSAAPDPSVAPKPSPAASPEPSASPAPSPDPEPSPSIGPESSPVPSPSTAPMVIDAPTDGATVRAAVLITGEPGLPDGTPWSLTALPGCVATDTDPPMGIATGVMPLADRTFATWDTTGVSDGPYRLRLAADVPDGPALERCVTVDNTAPIATLDGGVLRGDAVLTGTAVDAGLAGYRIDVAPGGSATGAWQPLDPAAAEMSVAVPEAGPLATWATVSADGPALTGTWGVRLVVRDVAGNETTVSTDVYLDNAPPPIAAGTGEAFTIPPGFTVELPADGDVRVQRSLFDIPVAGPDHTLILRYREGRPTRASLLGGWRSELTQSLTIADGLVVWHAPDGTDVPFVRLDDRWVGADGSAWSLAATADAVTLELHGPDAGVLVFEATAPGRLLRIEDGDGLGLDLAWTATAATATDAAGRSTVLGLDPVTGLVVSATDPAGRTWTLAYEDGSLASITDPMGATTRLRMENGRLTAIVPIRGRGAGGEALAWRLEPTDGETRVLTPDGEPATPDDAPRASGPGAPPDPRPTAPDPLAVLDVPADIEHRIERDADGRPIALVLDPSGEAATTILAHGDSPDGIAGLVTDVTDPTGRRTTYGYDALGRVTRVTIPMRDGADLVTRQRYDDLGSLVAVVDPAGTITRFITDDRGRVVRRIDACVDAGDTDAATCTGTGPHDGDTNVVTDLRYDGDGRLVSRVVRADGGDVRTDWLHDAAGHVIAEIVDPDGLAITRRWAFDADGRVVAERDARGRVTIHRRDDQGGIVETLVGCSDDGTPPGDAWATCEGTGPRDGTWNLGATPAATVARADAPVVPDRIRDAAGRLVLEVTPDPRDGADGTSLLRIRHAHDDAGRRCRTIVAATIDPAGLADPCNDPVPADGGDLVTTIRRDATGAVISVIGPDGTGVRYRHDDLGRLVERDGPGGRTTWRHDELGRIVERTDVSATGTLSVRWTFDAAGRAVRREAGDTVTTYRYDAAGDLLAATGPDGIVTVERDIHGRPLRVTAQDGTESTWTYRPDGVVRTDASGTYRVGLDDAGRTASLVTPFAVDPFRFERDAVGVLTALIAPSGAGMRLRHDTDGRLTAMAWQDAAGSRTGSIDLLRNAAGLVVSVTSDITGDPATGTMILDHDVQGRVIRAAGPLPAGYGRATPGDPVAWPDAGGGTDDGPVGCADIDGLRFTCDALGRLVVVRSATTDTVLARYAYDALDRLVSVAHSDDVLRIRYAGIGSAIAGFADADGRSTVDIITGPDGEPLGERDPAIGAVRLYGRDAADDIVLVTDVDGTPLATLRYDPWGEVLAASGAGLPLLRAGGALYDPITGLTWRGGRFTAPALGRVVTGPIDSTSDGAGPSRPQEGIR